LAGELKLGMLLPTREAVVTGRPESARLLGFATAAEEAGFDALWAGESPLARPRMDPLVLLSAVASRTERVGLGTAVILPALRQPFPTAHALASLDQLADGRLTVGVGGGFPMPTTEAEFNASGARFDQRIGRLVETVRIWRALWSSEEPIDFQGKYFSLDRVRLEPGPKQAGGPRLGLAGAAPAALRRTGRLFDGWLPYSPTTSEFSANLASAARRDAADAGLPRRHGGRLRRAARRVRCCRGEGVRAPVRDARRSHRNDQAGGTELLPALHERASSQA